jgi:hypothetical protein
MLSWQREWDQSGRRVRLAVEALLNVQKRRHRCFQLEEEVTLNLSRAYLHIVGPIRACSSSYIPRYSCSIGVNSTCAKIAGAPSPPRFSPLHNDPIQEQDGRVSTTFATTVALRNTQSTGGRSSGAAGGASTFQAQAAAIVWPARRLPKKQRPSVHRLALCVDEHQTTP